MTTHSALIIGASRGLGLALTQHYASRIPPANVHATVRSTAKADQFPTGVNVIENIDASKEDVGRKLVDGLQGCTVQLVFYVSGLLKPEEFGKSSWKDQIDMYTICAIAPVAIIESLVFSSALAPDAKIIFLTSEAGSIGLRTEGEGGGMYGHHGSKAAANMVGHLLSYDLKSRGVPIAMIHPGFLKTEMTRDAGMEQFYEQGGAVSPEEACKPIGEFVDKLDLSMSGRFWAPLGAKGIGNAEQIMGKDVLTKPAPLELPW